MRTQVNTTQSKEQKQTINKKESGKNPMQKDSWLKNDNQMITKKT
jgi:hypothetical protein